MNTEISAELNAARGLRARCEQAVATLPFPQPFPLTRLLRAVDSDGIPHPVRTVIDIPVGSRG